MPEKDEKCSRIFNGKVEKTRQFCVRRRAIERRWDVVSLDGRQMGSFSQIVQVSSWPTKPPIQWVPESLSARVKLPGSEADHSPISSAEITNAWSITATPQHSFMACTGTNFSWSWDYRLEWSPNKLCVSIRTGFNRLKSGTSCALLW